MTMKKRPNIQIDILYKDINQWKILHASYSVKTNICSNNIKYLNYYNFGLQNSVNYFSFKIRLNKTIRTGMRIKEADSIYQIKKIVHERIFTDLIAVQIS